LEASIDIPGAHPALLSATSAQFLSGRTGSSCPLCGAPPALPSCLGQFSKLENRKLKISDLLLSALDNLPQENFERFKDKLAHSDFEGKDNIPRGRLENADRIHTKNLLMEFYGGDAAVDVTIDVFTQINLRDSAMHPTRRGTRERSVPRCSKEGAGRFVAAPGGPRAQREQATAMRQGGAGAATTEGGCGGIFGADSCSLTVPREHEIMALGRRHAEIMTKHASPITIGDLFESDEMGQSPQIVVLQGAAGIGKTLTAKKIMLDWANEELYQNRFDYIFYINCREINFDRERGSVEDLILKNCPDHNAPTKEILMTPEKLLFIIDGFDELRFSFNQPTSNECSDPCEKQPVEITLNSLFRKKVLLKSYLLITTRPIALEKLGQCLKDERYAEILGFSENERKEYFYKFFEKEEQARKAFNFVKDNEMLFTMCFVPSACWIICTVLKQQMEAGEELARTSNTITGVYMLSLFNLLEGHSNNSKQQVQGNLKGLCSLAADGIWRENILFEEEDVKKYGLDKPDSLFLNENIFQKGIDCECVYSFIHLSFQEFFAALFYVLEKEETVKKSETAIQPVEKLFEKCGKSKNYLMLTVRFLFGLLNKNRMEEMEKNLSCKFSPKLKNNVLTWVKEKPFSSLFNYDKLSSDKETTIFYLDYFYCLYEIQETEFVKSAMNHFTELKLTRHTFTKMDQIVLQFCIKNCSKLESLWLENCMFLTEDLNEDSSGPCEWPHRTSQYDTLASHLSTEFQMKTMNALVILMERGWWAGSPVRTAMTSPLHTVIPLLCVFLSCSLGRCDLTDAGCGDLSAVLRANQSLTELELSYNKLGDAVVQLLCEILKHPNCKLQRLGLRSCHLTDTDCGDLAAVLSTNQSLIELDLSGNNPGDAGVRLLCEALKHPNCKLQRLDLYICRLKDADCEYLTAVLRTSQSLTELQLGANRLRDSGVQLLCEGLKHPNCKVQRLRYVSKNKDLSRKERRHLNKINLNIYKRTPRRCVCSLSSFNSFTSIVLLTD
uniref:NACHT, LRR and PYD domains-containing protein 3 n=1 Tax=Chelydra serpentina TaxID=8475 RepID=A0A8C3SBX9_CHESE